MTRLNLIPVLLVGLWAGIVMPATTAAGPPDCSGIDDVSEFDGPGLSEFADRLTTVRVASGLAGPVFAGSPPDRPDGPDDRLFIVEQRGTIRILDLATGTLLPDPFLDIISIVRDSGNEEGLLGLAFHPDYNTPGAGNEGRFFVYFTNNAGDNQVSRYGPSPDPNDADESTAETVLAIAHPTNSNHNGGPIAFGPDGFLYIGVGDGGSGCDPANNAQNVNVLLGKVLRINVDNFPPYTTPGNPFDGPIAGLDEIWAYGLRNPWRMSFDRVTGALYIGDVGQNIREEVDCQGAASSGGENYGWDLFEGSACPNPSCGGSAAGCTTIAHTAPILEYTHSRDGFSCSITGGYVYRGCRMSDLQGTYFYADFCSDNIRSFRTSGSCSSGAEINRTADLATAGFTINDVTSFGEDGRGEMYICDRGGEVFMILPELEIMEVSGGNAAPLRSTGSDIAWEDLQATSMHPIADYKVYRADDDPAGPFECVHRGPETTWAGGDPGDPIAGEVYYYLVTAVGPSGIETRPGYRSDGVPRTVDTLSGCP